VAKIERELCGLLILVRHVAPLVLIAQARVASERIAITKIWRDARPFPSSEEKKFLAKAQSSQREG
jgi:hypothetical protein